MGLFESILEQYESARHRGVISRLPRRRSPFPDRSDDGFLPPAKAAAVMRVSEAEVLELAARGRLEWREIAGRLVIRPAVVSVLGVETL